MVRLVPKASEGEVKAALARLVDVKLGGFVNDNNNNNNNKYILTIAFIGGFVNITLILHPH